MSQSFVEYVNKKILCLLHKTKTGVCISRREDCSEEQVRGMIKVRPSSETVECVLSTEARMAV